MARIHSALGKSQRHTFSARKSGVDLGASSAVPAGSKGAALRTLGVYRAAARLSAIPWFSGCSFRQCVSLHPIGAFLRLQNGHHRNLSLFNSPCRPLPRSFLHGEVVSELHARTTPPHLRRHFSKVARHSAANDHSGHWGRMTTVEGAERHSSVLV